MVKDSFKSNIELSKDAAFGQVDYETVTKFLFMVDINMMSALDLPFFSTKKCLIKHTDDSPMCCEVGDYHLILLTAKQNCWHQWVYQFAHEYCHHLINGPLSGEWSRMLWFEETLCQLSSIYNLSRMIPFCIDNGLSFYASAVKDYLENEMKIGPLYRFVGESGWYEGHKTSLSEVGYKRDFYRAIASHLFPLFIENPKLWKIILYIDDIRRWDSLESLFDHFQSNADESYSKSLSIMRNLFFV